MSSCILQPPVCGGVVRLSLKAPRAHIALDLTLRDSQLSLDRSMFVVPTPRIMISASASVSLVVTRNHMIVYRVYSDRFSV